MRKGFTLIELLIVVTIIAVLAGAAIPYVQEYVEDARISRVKADLGEITRALVRYELDKGDNWPTAETTLTKLVGPYLGKALIDPWGTPYVINEGNSVVYSAGPNRVSTITDADNISAKFRPPLATTKAFWIDADNSGTVSSGDQMSLRYSRPLKTGVNYTATDFFLNINGSVSAMGTTAAHGTMTVLDGRILQITFTTSAVFVPGRDSLISSGNNIRDQATTPYGPNNCLVNEVTIQALQ